MTKKPKPVDVTDEGVTRLPPAMVEELGKRIWFLRGKDGWEAWGEDKLEAILSEAREPEPPISFFVEGADFLQRGALTEIAIRLIDDRVTVTVSVPHEVRMTAAEAEALGRALLSAAASVYRQRASEPGKR